MQAPLDLSRNVVCMLGLPFDAVTMQEAVDRVRAAAQQRTPFLVSTANLNFAVAAGADEAFRNSVVHSQLCLADGMPIVWVSRLLGLPVRERVSGADLFEALCAAAKPAVKVFFFGGPDGVAQAACEQVNRRQGGVECVGFESPGFVPVESMSSDDCIERINRAAPDFVIVSLGAQKGQAWIERNRSRLRAPVISHLGAVVNFAAGAVRRAPPWLQRVGLEWLWRVKEEPGLWRRYARDAVAFTRMFAGDVVPLCWQRVRMGWRHASTPPTFAFDAGDSGIDLRLNGAFDQKHVDVLRTAFAAAAAAAVDVRIDLSGVDYLDAAGMALFLLLSAHQRDGGRRLELRRASPLLRRQFRYHHVEALLTASPQDEHPAGQLPKI